MATKESVKNTLFLPLDSHNSKTKSGTGRPHFLLLENNQHVMIKHFEKLKKKIVEGIQWHHKFSNSEGGR